MRKSSLPPKRRNGRWGCRKVYPWSDWFDGKPHVLTQGVHFQVGMESFRDQVHIAAQRRGLLADTRKQGEKQLVLLALRKDLGEDSDA